MGRVGTLISGKSWRMCDEAYLGTWNTSIPQRASTIYERDGTVDGSRHERDNRRGSIEASV